MKQKGFELKFKSIRQKLIRRVTVILMVSFFGLLGVVALLNTNVSEKNLKSSEESVKSSLIAKGRTLISNNSQALKGMVDDH